MQLPVAHITRILVVEDDPPIAASLVRSLRGAGYEVELVQEGNRAAELGLSGDFDAVLLDLNLPGATGFDILEQWQGRLDVPIIVLSSDHALERRVRSFELGAIDFIPKPFWIEEVLARVEARLAWLEKASTTVLQLADVTVDLTGHRAVRNGVDLGLSHSEFSVLAHLLGQPGVVVSRAQLVDRALSGEVQHTRAVDVVVSRIRRRLGSGAAAHIVTVWKAGYRFDPPK